MSWFAAKEHCEGKGGKLVEINSEEENIALVDEINRRGYADRNMHFWIGLTEMTEVEGEWRLVSSLRQSPSLSKSVNPIQKFIFFFVYPLLLISSTRAVFSSSESISTNFPPCLLQ